MGRKKAPGRHYRRGISLMEAVREFGDDAKAEAWLVAQRWPDGVICYYCESKNVSRRKPHPKRKTPQHHCNDCKRDFTVKTGTLMHDSKLPLGKWAMAFYLFTTNLKGVSSMKLRRDLGITQKTAWHMAHRIREVYYGNVEAPFEGPVEVDEAYFGGKEHNRHAQKKMRLGRGPVGKVPVVGMRDRQTGRVAAEVVPRVDKLHLQGFVVDKAKLGATVYTDENRAYDDLPFFHGTVKHTVGEYVSGQAHINGVESFWSMLKRGYMGTFHRISPKHLDRYVVEFAGRHNDRPMDTEDQMSAMARRSIGKRLKYEDLVRPPPK